MSDLMTRTAAVETVDVKMLQNTYSFYILHVTNGTHVELVSGISETLTLSHRWSKPCV
jgi:hypothetical protein